jgi:DNA-binding response OmpR family regulator
MGASIKRLVPQEIESSSVSLPLAAIFPESSGRAYMVVEKEMRRLSQFLPVIVLVPKSAVNGKFVPSEFATKSYREGTETALLKLLDKSVTPSRRPSTEGDSAFGDVIVNFSEMTAYRKGQPVSLTTLEFKTLKYLMQNPRRVIPRDELLNEVWGYENYPCTRTVDNHILKLRHKLEREPSQPVHFLTVHGAGYKFLP